MGQKKTRKLLKKLLSNENKRAMYTQEELIYMEKHLELMKLRKQQRKQNNKGFKPNNE